MVGQSVPVAAVQSGVPVAGGDPPVGTEGNRTGPSSMQHDSTEALEDRSRDPPQLAAHLFSLIQRLSLSSLVLPRRSSLVHRLNLNGAVPGTK